MILNVWRVFRSLAWYHHAMIVVTVVMPLFWSEIITLWVPDRLVLKVIRYPVAILALFLLAELFVALALKKDRSKAEQFVFHEVEVVSGAVRTLREQHGGLIEQHRDSMEDLQQQIDDLNKRLRSSFEELGVAFQPREVRIRGKISSGIPTLSATIRVTGGSKRARFFRWFRRTVRRLWEAVYGKSGHH